MTRTKSDGAAIRQLREARGLSCPQLAARAGIHRSHLDRIEKGDRGGSPRIRLALARALDVDLKDITTQIDTTQPAEQAA